MLRWTDWIARQRRSRWLLLLVLLAVAVRLVWALVMIDRQPRFDELAYIGHAERLQAGHGYVNKAGVPDDFWPPGFPALLAAAFAVFGRYAITGVGLQVVIGALTCVLVSLIGERFFGRRIGRVAGLVAALYPTHVFYSTLMLTEPLATLLLVTAAALLLWSLRVGAWGALAAGAIFGLAILTRPVLLLIPAIVPVWYAVNGIRARRALGLGALTASAAVAVLSPWLARNHREFGTWTEVSSTGGYIFLGGNNPRALGGYLGPPDLSEQLSRGGRVDASRGYRIGWEAIRASPLVAIVRAVQKTSYLVALETDGVLWNLKGLRSRPSMAVTLTLLAIANLAYVLVVIGTLLGLSATPGHRPFTTLFGFIAVYVLVMAMTFVGDPRYHYSLIPFAAIFFAKALVQDGPALVAAWHTGEPISRVQLRRWIIPTVIAGLLMLGNLWLKHVEVQRFG